MRYAEDTLKSWTAPLSDTEEQRVKNTVQMINESIRTHEKLSDCSLEIFAQGSFANNTNVKQNSDVDICVMLTSTFFGNYVDGKSYNDYGFTTGSITYDDYKSYVVEALKAKFGDQVITIGNKSICIGANSYHITADVVPAFQYRDYKNINSLDCTKYIDGIKFFAKDGTEIINYPKDHINNGKEKNNKTNYEYKKLVRIMKHIFNDMVDDGKANKNKITSFLIECLVWNVPNNTINGSDSWWATIQASIAHLWNAINEEKCKDWGEVSERLYLFHPGRKWTMAETKEFLFDMYNYLEFN